MRVRDELWLRATKSAKDTGWVLQVWSDRNPQGFSYRQHGTHSRVLCDFEGLGLVTTTPTAGRTRNAETDRG